MHQVEDLSLRPARDGKQGYCCKSALCADAFRRLLQPVRKASGYCTWILCSQTFS